MNNCQAVYCARPGRLDQQLRQQVPGWSGHIAGWLDQTDIPVHLVRYEDLKGDTAAIFRARSILPAARATDEEIVRAVAFADFTELQRQEQDKGFSETPRRPGGLFFRRGEAGTWRDELTPNRSRGSRPRMRR